MGLGIVLVGERGPNGRWRVRAEVHKRGFKTDGESPVCGTGVQPGEVKNGDDKKEYKSRGTKTEVQKQLQETDIQGYRPNTVSSPSFLKGSSGRNI